MKGGELNLFLVIMMRPEMNMTVERRKEEVKCGQWGIFLVGYGRQKESPEAERPSATQKRRDKVISLVNLSFYLVFCKGNTRTS